MTADIWRQHAKELAREHRLTIHENLPAGTTQAHAWPARRVVEIPPLDCVGSYSALLHEIGHILMPCLPQIHRAQIERLDSSTTARRCCDCELVSWQWAASVARPAWTPEMHAEASRSIQTYVRTHADASETARINSWLTTVTRRQDAHAARVAWLRQARAETGAFPCAEPGCRRKSETLHGDAPLCINHQLDRQIADQRRRVAAMQPTRRSA